MRGFAKRNETFRFNILGLKSSIFKTLEVVFFQLQLKLFFSDIFGEMLHNFCGKLGCFKLSIRNTFQVFCILLVPNYNYNSSIHIIVLDPGRPFQPRAMFKGKTRSLLKRGLPERYSTPVGSSLTRKRYARLGRLASDKL